MSANRVTRVIAVGNNRSRSLGGRMPVITENGLRVGVDR
jgi:hypothetical protein